MGRIVDLTGKRFGRLTVIGKAAPRINVKGKRELVWHCQCDCGMEKDVLERSLLYAGTSSCGCLQKEYIGKLRRSHGDTGTRLYQAWENMRARCNRKSSREYENYGGRGITVCAEWQESYEAFKKWALENGYADNLTLDRIKIDGNYEPSNYRWISNKAQQSNKRNNRKITFNGKTQTLNQWAKELGMVPKTLQGRLDKSGWSVEKALTTPVDKSNANKERWSK